MQDAAARDGYAVLLKQQVDTQRKCHAGGRGNGTKKGDRIDTRLIHGEVSASRRMGN